MTGDTSAPKKRHVDPLLWIVPLALSCLGILMVTSTTSPGSYAATGSPFSTGILQLLWLGLGIVAMISTYLVPIEFWERHCGALALFSFALVAATLVPGVGVSVGGARRWLPLVLFRIQPSEVLTFAMIFVFAKVADKNERDPDRCFVKFIIWIAASCALLMMQPDLGSTLLIVLIGMGMYVERFGWKRPLIASLVLMLLFAVFIYLEPYRMRRVAAFFDPWQDPFDKGFQTIQGLIAFANGGLWGSGLGHGFQKLNYLPAAYTDFIYAAIGEELGLAGTLGILALCLIWTARGRHLYNRVPDGFMTSVVWGGLLSVMLPFFINIAGVTKLLPLTGMPLPFLSYGGSAMFMLWMRVGLLLRVHKEYLTEEE